VAKALKPFTQPTAFQIAVGCAKSIKKMMFFVANHSLKSVT